MISDQRPACPTHINDGGARFFLKRTDT